MGERLRLNYTKTARRFKTRLGGLVTLLIIVLSLIALFVVFSEYFDTSSPIVTTARELSPSAQSLNIFDKGLFPAVMVAGMDGQFENLKMSKYFTIQAQIFKKTVNLAKNTTEIGVTKRYHYIPCSEIKEHDSLLVILRRAGRTVDFRSVLCPHYKEVENNATISFDPKSLSSEYLSIKFYPCTLPNKDECYPMNRVFGAEAMLGGVSNLTSPEDFENPVGYRWFLRKFLIDITRTKSYRHVLQGIKIFDDRSFIENLEAKADYAVYKLWTTDSWARDMTQLHCTPQMIEAGDCEEYFEFVYEMASEVVITTRRYKNAVGLLCQFGGILKLLTTMFFMLSFIILGQLKNLSFPRFSQLRDQA